MATKMSAVSKPTMRSKAKSKAPTPPALKRFVWEGRDRRGNKQKGELSATNQAMAKSELRRQGVIVTKMRQKSSAFGEKRKRITPFDIAIFSRQLCTMLNAGVALVQSIEIQAKGSDNKNMEELLMAIKTDVEQGATLAEAFGKHPRHFDDLFVSLVAAGEQAGALDQLLDEIATYKEKTESLKRKVKKALFYPAAVVAVAFVVSLIFLLFVVPQFAAMFQNFGADLPAFTQLVVDLSEWLTSYWWIALGLGVGIGFSFFEAKKRSRKFRNFLDHLSLKIPVVGPITVLGAISRFARTLCTMFAAGVPLVDALESVAGAVGNVVYEDAIIEIKDQVAMGQPLNAAMRQADLFPSMVLQMVSIGEESGALDEMLMKVAEFYEEELDTAVDGLSSLIEPLIMALLGVIVGGFVVAMYLPIFQMGSVI